MTPTRFAVGLAVVLVAADQALAAVARRARTRPWAAAVGLLLGGAATHLLDRLFRQPGPARGHVVDFIDYGGLFVGNLADIAPVAGVALMFLLNVRGVPLGGPAERPTDAPAG